MMMALVHSGDGTAGLRTKIEALQREIASDRAEALRYRGLATKREDLLDELARDETSGRLTREQVDEQLAKADRDASVCLQGADARERAANLREQEVERLERQLDEIAFVEQLQTVSELAETRARADALVPKALSAALNALRRAADAADAEEEARDSLEQLRPEGEERAVEVEDGPGWPDVDQLIEFLRQGPSQPKAKAAAARERQRRRQSATDNEVAVSFVRQYGRRSDAALAALRTFSEPMQRRIIAVFEKAEAEAAQRRAAAEAESGFVRVEA